MHVKIGDPNCASDDKTGAGKKVKQERDRVPVGFIVIGCMHTFLNRNLIQAFHFDGLVLPDQLLHSMYAFGNLPPPSNQDKPTIDEALSLMKAVYSQIKHHDVKSKEPPSLDTFSTTEL